MSKWVERNRDRIEFTLSELKRLHYMNIDTGNLNLNNVVFLLNSMSQELTRVERDRDSHANENEKLKTENNQLKEEISKIKNENSSF